MYLYRIYKVSLRPTDKVIADNDALPALKMKYPEFLVPPPRFMSEAQLIKALKTGLVLEATQLGEMEE